MLKMAVNIAVFGAFLLMAIVFGFFLWQTLFAPKEYSEGAPNSKPAYSEQKTSGEHALGGGLTPSHTNPTEEAIAEYTKWLAIFTLFLVLATIGLFVSGERNIEVARESANAAKQSADVARDAVLLSDKTAERQLRAYLFIETAHVSGSGSDYRGVADIKNAGQTPAYKVNFRSRLGMSPATEPFPSIPFSSPENLNVMLGPGNVAVTEGVLEIPPNRSLLIAGLDTGATVFYFEVRVSYEDIFRKHHFLNVRFQSHGRENGIWVLAATPNGYETDQ
jgi:hypothetical protein